VSAAIKAIGVAGLIAVYALLSHWLLITPALQSWAAAWAVLPLLLLAILFLINLMPISVTLKILVAAMLGVLSCTLLYQYWPLVTRNNDNIYFMQHVGTNAILAWLFGHTLVGLRIPFITSLARMVHPDLPPQVARYTRQATLAWTLFFVLNGMVSIVLFFAAPLSYWSFFGNVLNWPLVGIMFLLEYGARKLCIKDFKPATIRQSIDAYMQQQQRKGASKPTSSS
jgi:uncharacterized membrane protein